MQKYMVCIFIWLASVLPGSSRDLQVPVRPLQSEDQLVLTSATLGILVNENDPNSARLAEQYAILRNIPNANIIRLNLPNVSYVARHLMVRELDRLKKNQNYTRLAGFVLAFDRPFRVDRNQSITSAISQGIATMRWQGNCNETVSNPDAGKSAGAALITKPSMMLTAGGRFEDSLALAKRGKDADRSDPDGKVVLLQTSDTARSRPREPSMKKAEQEFARQIDIEATEERRQWERLIGFQTGLASVPSLEQLYFLPGAYADHLTSYGGVIEGANGQMPATAWIRAGATASFGTVREPCNFSEKFPDPTLVLRNYLSGDTILEAYWKSVSMMTEGLFIGEPLARPFSLMDASEEDGYLVLRANRHTEAFLKRDGSVAATGAAEEKMKLGLFWVETGKPVLITDVDFAMPVEPEAIMAKLRLPGGRLEGREIGILLRQ